MKNKNRKFDNRQNIDLKSQFKKIEVGVKNGVFIFTSPLTVEQFSKKINIPVSNILKNLFMKGKMLNLNSLLTEEQIGELCLEYNFDFEKKQEINETNILDNINIKDDPKSLVKRPPIVTVMGHVDHGKTTLLDFIRKSHVIDKEAGGITQHIGAYQITYQNNHITFLDTPGHEAFTQMRARGASLTDIVVLVVAADDGIKPQTKEAIDHARAANVPIIVFINKIDKPEANIEKTYTQLSEYNLTPEEWGGETITIKGSALKGTNVDKLLEAILLLADLNDYKANPNRLANGVVIESNIDKGYGPVATLLIKSGTLRKGDFIIVGSSYGKIRSLLNENNKEVHEALPSTPIRITGINEPAAAGDHFVVSNNKDDIKDIAKKIKNQEHILAWNQLAKLNNSNDTDGIKKINIILKTDVHGSKEAILGMISKIDIPGTKINVILSSVGTISESDVQLAIASKALIFGFNVRPARQIKALADQSKVNIYFYDIIYRLNEDLKKLLVNTLDPVLKEQDTGELEVRQTWKLSKIGTIVGCYVLSGEVSRNDKVRILRNGSVIYNTEITSMKHIKDDISKAVQGTECGIILNKFNDIKVGDIIQSYKIVKEEQKI